METSPETIGGIYLLLPQHSY